MANLSSREVRDRMPESLLYEISDLLRSPSNNATRTMTLNIYERKLRGLLLRMDCHAAVQDIDAPAGQSTYETSEATVRILSVLFGDIGLYKTASAPRDLLHPDWQSAENGTPEVWWNEQVDPGVDSESEIAAEHFMVRPAPATADDLHVYTTVIPDDGALAATFLNPILVYESVAQGIKDMWWEKETEEHEENNMAVAEFFTGLAVLWEEVIKNRTLL